jgi:hypothetical protein
VPRPPGPDAIGEEEDRLMTRDTDVVVIGLGVGGEHVAERLAEEGLDVVGVEAELVGGECPYWGCVPSKMMIRAGNLVAEARRVSGLAGSAEVRADWAPVADQVPSAGAERLSGPCPAAGMHAASPRHGLDGVCLETLR